MRDAAPTRSQRMRDPQLIEDARDDKIDEVVDRLRPAVESWRRREDNRAGARELKEVLEMDRRQRCLARHKHQRPALLEHHVGSALDQIVGETARRARRAVPMLQGQIAIASGGIGARRDRREPILPAEYRELSRLRAITLGEERRRRMRLRGQRELELLPRDDLRGRRIDEVDADLRRKQALEQAQAVRQCPMRR